MCPVIFEYGDFRVSGYWFLISIGLLASYLYLAAANARLKDRKIAWYHRNNLFALGMISILAGGTLLGFFVNLPGLIRDWDYYSQSLSLIREKAFSSVVFYGGAIMLIFALWYYVRHYHLNGETVIELFVPASALFMTFARTGCFMAGCCYGIEVSWGVVFPEGSLAPAGVPLFPSQLAEAAGHLLLFFLFLSVKDKLRKKRDLLILYLGGYAVMRFILEYFRGDANRGFLLGLSTSQWISLLLLLVVVIYTFRNIYTGRTQKAGVRQ